VQGQWGHQQQQQQHAPNKPHHASLSTVQI
jgi:hypothetical protein